ncbi:adenylate/guanylate cyclase domain-containing protein [Flavobacterium sp. A45]|uniref:adenylate/guanylate cyclase domain-containing protein n=1 Tax=Flavobacterium sp. A45 TaxID=1945862 RepID=UPI0009D52AF9|nr:adenylate/guanylate cyclase domain-containing protein [Flavobacterium sp. A45]OOG78471.1 adenylate/guanylate cyclase domain-containing protein [Flavobacterium sp. A45]
MIQKKDFNYFKKSAVLVLLLFFQQFDGFAQNQKVADSLVKIYKKNTLNNSEKMELLRNLSFNESNNLQLALKYARELIALAKSENNYLYLYRGYNQSGNKFILTGDYNKALDSYFKSAQAAVKAQYVPGEGMSYTCIANVYSTMGNAKNAEVYYDKAIQILRKATNQIALATALLNAGDEYSKNLKLNLALNYFNEAGTIFKSEDYQIGVAYTLGNTGMVYAKQGKDELAIKYINAAISILEKQEDYYGVSDYLFYMSDIYFKQKDWKSALYYAKRSLKLAQKQGLKEQVQKSSLMLSDLYQQTGNIPEAFSYYKKFIIYRDSIKNLAEVEKMGNLRTDFEVSKKQAEVDLMMQQKRTQKIIAISSIVSLVLVFFLAVGLFRRYRFIKKTNSIIEAERKRSDTLLLNILPEETALELKESGKVVAKRFESVTVLFTDFEGFTQYAENLSPEKLVESVDYYFSKFDAIIEKYDLEKIKTLGDSYMCAGGLPFPTEDHARKMILAAQEILEFVKHSNRENPLNHTRFNIRIGINTGPVVAGVVGTKKFAYDIWGDTVNIASRMESNSSQGKINISENTFSIVKDSFDCEYRGEVEVKNRGMMKMYFVNNER